MFRDVQENCSFDIGIEKRAAPLYRETFFPVVFNHETPCAHRLVRIVAVLRNVLKHPVRQQQDLRNKRLRRPPFAILQFVE